MKRLLIALLAIFWLVAIAVPASAVEPDLPQAFYGALTIDGLPARVGTRVEARGAGVLTGITGNPITTTLQGAYGGAGGFDPKLIVQGSIAPGATVSFLVNGDLAQQAVTWASGQVTRLDLTVVRGAVAPPPGGGGGQGGGGGGGGGGGTGTGNVSLTGLKTQNPLTVDTSGKVQTAVTLESTSGKPAFNLDIPAGTAMTTATGTPLTSITVTVPASPPPPPPQNTVVLTQDFGPDGATFNPPINLSFKFDPAKLPAGVTESNLTIAYWNGSAWTTVPATIDTNAKVITASVSHFTIFAVMAKEAPAAGQVSAPVAQPSPSLAPVSTPTPAPAPVPSPAPVLEPAPAPVPAEIPVGTNWVLMAGLVAGTVLVVGLIGFLLRRKIND